MANPDMESFAGAQRFDPSADSAQIAAAIIDAFQTIDDTLRPIVGERGVVALVSRSVYLASVEYPWFADVSESAQSGINPTALVSILTLQGSANAAAAGETLLKTFHALLSALIGPSLTERLLYPTCESSKSGRPRRIFRHDY